ncbi:MAG: DUF2785 domain-containing protein [Acholeplasmataceae bacterium]|jgi:hypothetical protein|nr:DUF2785 domain-containing protein [Acholeplasmataceae bacterium]
MNQLDKEKEINVDLLEALKHNDYDFSQINLLHLQDYLLKHIGHPDPHIRDDLVYAIFAHLILDHHLGEDELTSICYRMLSEDFLTYDLENKVEHSVLKRSFTLLQLVVIVYIHRRDHIIAKKTMMDLLNIFLDYTKLETVHQGYDPKVGWIHTIAHSADLFGQLMQIEWISESELKLLFNGIREMIKGASCYLMYNEDERMVVAVKKGLDRHILPQDYLSKWIKRFGEGVLVETLPENIFYKNNIKNFLKTLYFTLSDQDSYNELTSVIKSTLSLLVKK